MPPPQSEAVRLAHVSRMRNYKRMDNSNGKSGWEVRECVPSTRGGLHVRGINHEATDAVDREFSWEINQWSLRDERFDFSGATYKPGAQERLALLRKLAAKL